MFPVLLKYEHQATLDYVPHLLKGLWYGRRSNGSFHPALLLSLFLLVSFLVLLSPVLLLLLSLSHDQ